MNILDNVVEAAPYFKQLLGPRIHWAWPTARSIWYTWNEKFSSWDCGLEIRSNVEL